MRLIIFMMITFILLPFCLAATGLSLDTSSFVGVPRTPVGDTSNLQPKGTGNGWAIEMWLKYSPTVTRVHTLYTQFATDPCVVDTFDNYQFSINTLADDTVRVDVDWCGGSLTLTTTDALQVGVWQHLSVVFRKQQGIWIFFDGKLVRSSFDVLPEDDPLLLSFTWDADEPFINAANIVVWDDTGLIDELRFWDSAPSNSGIKKNYCRRLTSGPVAVWNFDSNLGSDGVTRVFLNTTFDVASSAGAANNFFYTTELNAAWLVKEENDSWCAGDVPTTAIIIVSIFAAVIGLVIMIWIGFSIWVMVTSSRQDSSRSYTQL